MTRVLQAVALVAAFSLSTGCANYQLGTGKEKPFQSLYLEPVSTQVLVPQAQAILSTRLREAFVRDGRVQSGNSPTEAEVTLSVAITEYHRAIAAARADDTGLARKYNVTLGATCTLRETRSGRLLWDKRTLNVTREVFTDSGQQQSEYQTLALLTEALAHRVVQAALDTW